MLEVTNKNKARIGDIVEIKAHAWLLEQGYEVFNNVSSKGPIDLVIYDTESDTFRKVDVKKVVDGDRKRVRVYQPTPTELQRKIGVEFLFYDGKLDTFAWNVTDLRLQHKLDYTPKTHAPKPIKLSSGENFESQSAMCRHYGVNPCSVRSAMQRGMTAEEAINSVLKNQKALVVDGKKFPNKRAVSEFYGVNHAAVEYWMYEKGYDIKEAIDILLEKNK